MSAALCNVIPNIYAQVPTLYTYLLHCQLTYVPTYIRHGTGWVYIIRRVSENLHQCTEKNAEGNTCSSSTSYTCLFANTRIPFDILYSITARNVYTSTILHNIIQIIIWPLRWVCSMILIIGMMAVVCFSFDGCVWLKCTVSSSLYYIILVTRRLSR